jgi:hypothetical protein
MSGASNTSVQLRFPASGGLGSLDLSLEVDESGHARSLEVQYRLGASSTPSHWLPSSIIGPLQLALRALDAIQREVPDAEMYLETRLCPQCRRRLDPFDGLGGEPCYTCRSDNWRGRGETGGPVIEL